jgi:hypothetical protein
MLVTHADGKAIRSCWGSLSIPTLFLVLKASHIVSVLRSASVMFCLVKLSEAPPAVVWSRTHQEEHGLCAGQCLAGAVMVLSPCFRALTVRRCGCDIDAKVSVPVRRARARGRGCSPVVRAHIMLRRACTGACQRCSDALRASAFRLCWVRRRSGSGHRVLREGCPRPVGVVSLGPHSQRLCAMPVSLRCCRSCAWDSLDICRALSSSAACKDEGV